MTKLTKGGVAFSGLFDGIDRVLAEWNPGSLKNERQFKDVLLGHLRASVPPPPTCRIEPEYRDGGTTADIYLKWQGFLFTVEVFFELKHNLTRKTDFDRLVGQLHGLEPGKRRIIVVLCGRTDQALLGRLKELFRNHLETSSIPTVWDASDPAMRIILKPDPEDSNG